MKKKLIAIVVMTMLLCGLLALPSFAAKPGIQVYITFRTNSAGGVSPTVHYRNNTGKQLKYIDFYMTPYNAVNDVVRCEIGQRYTYGEETGPIDSFTGNLENAYDAVAIANGQCYSVYTDSKGCPYVYDKDYNQIYLTADDVNTMVLDRDAYFECMWYNWHVDHIAVPKVVVTYMNGSKQTFSGSSIMMVNAGKVFHNQSFNDMKKSYTDVYDYKEYREYNQDLVSVFGDDEHKYIEHFIQNGMKEGRRGKKDFDLTAYKENNPDLVAVFGDDNVKYYEHYISSGKAEGRKATVSLSNTSTTTATTSSTRVASSTLTDEQFAELLEKYSSVYNAKEYMRYNVDVAILGGNKKALLEHFINSGMKEGRQASSQFNLEAYKTNNPDLVAQFGDDNIQYYEHYIASGKAEDRKAI